MTFAARQRDATPETARPLLEQLRSATADAHACLEGRLRLLDADSTLERYGRFLHATFEVLSALDRPLSAHLGAIYVLPGAESRLARLRHDLESFAPAPISPAAVPLVVGLPSAYGAGYVLQGSLLGGAVISRHLRERFGLGDAGTRYLQAYGNQIGPAWRQFTASLDAFGQRASAHERQVVVDSARKTFEAFGSALSRHGFGHA